MMRLHTVDFPDAVPPATPIKNGSRFPPFAETRSSTFERNECSFWFVWFWDNEGMDALDSNKLLVFVVLLVLLIFLLPFPTEQFNSINCEMCFEGLPFPLNIASPEGVDTAGLFGERGEEDVGESGGVRENVVCRIFPLLCSSQDVVLCVIEKEIRASFIIIYNLVSTAWS
jgi:hypothetical protein